MNSSSQHTPLPWSLAPMPNSVCIWTDAYETGRGVAVTGMNARTPAEAQANAAFIVLACNSFESLRQENARAHESYEGMNAAHQQLNDEHAKLLASNGAMVKALKRARHKIEEEWGIYAERDLAMIDAALNSAKASQ